jgi:hypothetical protein
VLPLVRSAQGADPRRLYTLLVTAAFDQHSLQPDASLDRGLVLWLQLWWWRLLRLRLLLLRRRIVLGASGSLKCCGGCGGDGGSRLMLRLCIAGHGSRRLEISAEGGAIRSFPNERRLGGRGRRIVLLDC